MRMPWVAGALCLLAVTSASAEDWSAVPQGKARIVVYTNFWTTGQNNLAVRVDGGAEFSFNCSENNLVLDLTPGPHTLSLVYTNAFGARFPSGETPFILPENYVGYWEFWLGRGEYLQPVTMKRFVGIAGKRAATMLPEAGGRS